MTDVLADRRVTAGRRRPLDRPARFGRHAPTRPTGVRPTVSRSRKPHSGLPADVDLGRRDRTSILPGQHRGEGPSQLQVAVVHCVPLNLTDPNGHCAVGATQVYPGRCSASDGGGGQVRESPAQQAANCGCEVGSRFAGGAAPITNSDGRISGFAISIPDSRYTKRDCERFGGAWCDRYVTALLPVPAPGGPKNYCGDASWLCTAVGYNQLRNCGWSDQGTAECLQGTFALISDFVVARSAARLGGVALDSLTASSDGTSSRLAFPGGLAANDSFPENHVLSHVGLTDAQLAARGIGAASTFSDRATAEAALADVLLDNQTSIQAWLAAAKPGAKAPFSSTFESPIGRILYAGSTNTVEGFTATAVLRADPSSPLGYTIRTGFVNP